MSPTIPNMLTVARIVMIPLFLVAFYLPFGWSGMAAAFLFALASATDWLDGYLARRWQQTSAFGAFLDPVADKLMVAVALIAILQKDPRILMALPVAIIIGREITVSALREWMAELGKRASVAVSVLGKLKTTVQMAAVVLLLLRHGLPGVPAYRLGVAGLYLAAALTMWSMIQYLRAAWPVLNEDRPGGAS
ncbi:MAG TPA: CDP-diacylglycerol--glycerol-3-phosphate 3-phosphatidyltransferase [Gammaproteobacteria bacterium]|nr:CDP-diacylglycerol--glycerol-3-phosphate 3-phosphatidyltransferase [Gammaproteobacteria bacterium]